jgi:hypothetical protein
MKPHFQSIHSQACLILDLPSAKGMTHRMVKTDDWHDGLHTMHHPSHNALGRHATLEQKNHPRWISEMMIKMSLVGGTA